MTTTTLSYSYNFKDYKNPTKEFLNFLSDISKEIMHDVNDSSWDHNDSDECKERWSTGENWSHKRIIGKLINQAHGYDYVGNNCPGLTKCSEWDNGLNSNDFRNKSLHHLKFNKKTYEITTN